MPRRTRDHSNTPPPSSRKETGSRSCAPAHPLPSTFWGACGRPFPHRCPCRWIDLKGPDRPAASAPLSSRRRRVFPETSRGRARPFKRFCPPLTHSPHSHLSYPLSGFRCAANNHLQSLSKWQSGDASSFLPLLPVPLSLAARMIGDMLGSLPQPTGPVPPIFSPVHQSLWLPHPEQKAFLHGGWHHPLQTFSTP